MSTLVAIDWGSSNRRAYVLENDVIIDRHLDAEGVLTCGGDFAASLAALLARWPGLAVDAPVLMSGMIGSRSGWVEAPYLPCPAPLSELGRHLIEIPQDRLAYSPTLSTRRVCIVPGVCRTTEPDVMRGEEIQVLGSMLLSADGGDGLYVLPGTHSKWVRVEHGRITAFRSFMTGELFALLGKHSSLASLLTTPTSTSPAESEAFAAGVAAAGRDEPLSHLFFSLRAGVLLGAREAAQGASWLSGLLIGTEWHDARVREWLTDDLGNGLTNGPANGPANVPTKASGEVRIVGEPHLAARYASVAASLGVATRIFEPEAAFIAAVPHVWSRRL